MEGENKGEIHHEDILEERKNKIKKFFFGWVEDKYDKYFLAVFIFAIIIRLYHFIQVGAQPLWWDELCYGSLAKNMFSHMWDGTHLIQIETSIRPFFFSFLWSLLLRMRIPEIGTRFILEFLPSIFSVFFVYLVGKEVFNKRVGALSAFIFSVLWIHLFYTLRLLTNVPALLFLFSSIYFFIKATKRNFNFKYFAISLFLLSISTLTRYPNGIVFFVYLFMLIIGKNFLIKNKEFWSSGIIGVSPLLIFFIYNYINYRNIFPALLGGDYFNRENIVQPIAFHFLNYIPIFLQKLFFIFFLIGLIIILFELFVGYNFIPKNKKLQNYLLIFLIIMAIYSYFIFYLRLAEDRYFFPTALSLSCIAGFGLDYIYQFIKKYNKHISILFLLSILFFGAYLQISYANNLINIKKTSYLQMKQAFEWIKATAPEKSFVLGSGTDPYAVYYADMNFLYLPPNYSEGINDSGADYLIDHIFTPRPEYMDEYLNENSYKWNQVNAFFFDEQKTQPAVAIYEKISSE